MVRSAALLILRQNLVDVYKRQVISMRGRGRIKVEAITGTSRKGRIGVYLKRFM